MTRVIIIEDESAAAERVKKLLKQIAPDFVLETVIESVEDGIAWFETHPQPDLILSDIQLSDGLSFEIYEKMQIRCRIIFITAYDEFAIKAFKLNSVDYLLKPVDKDDFSQSIKKFTESIQTPVPDLSQLLNSLKQEQPNYKTRLLVKDGQNLKPISIDEIAYFYINNQLVYFITRSKKMFYVDQTLDELEKQLNPNHFFRISRQMMVSKSSVQNLIPYFNSRIKLELTPVTDQEALVSREKVNDFKRWLEKG